ncbi:hypothetical protein C8F01DRAFT_1257773 [Mycena amicta]|nr:hypothetical protein C8F01DRAFT_1257773 [Mycena amicta]
MSAESLSLPLRYQAGLHCADDWRARATKEGERVRRRRKSMQSLAACPPPIDITALLQPIPSASLNVPPTPAVARTPLDTATATLNAAPCHHYTLNHSFQRPPASLDVPPPPRTTYTRIDGAVVNVNVPLCQKYPNSPASLDDPPPPHSICTGVDAAAFEIDVPSYRCHQVLRSEAQQLPSMSPLCLVLFAAPALMAPPPPSSSHRKAFLLKRNRCPRRPSSASYHSHPGPSFLSPTASLDVPPPHCSIPHRPPPSSTSTSLRTDPSFRKPSTSLDVSSPLGSVRTRVNDAVVDVDVLLR